MQPTALQPPSGWQPAVVPVSISCRQAYQMGNYQRAGESSCLPHQQLPTTRPQLCSGGSSGTESDRDEPGIPQSSQIQITRYSTKVSASRSCIARSCSQLLPPVADDFFQIDILDPVRLRFSSTGPLIERRGHGLK
jgi:hypothetical protein